MIFSILAVLFFFNVARIAVSRVTGRKIDTSGGAALRTHFTREHRISTVDTRVDYLR